ncbi:MAG: hypothetical protein HOG19_14155 [Gammaproteobacteria bacterium]|mgnify:CR=1 FL=1|jgi:hypothetical protein|nr:hypothetical protein [Gammaproteobacteria bacterium]
MSKATKSDLESLAELLKSPGIKEAMVSVVESQGSTIAAEKAAEDAATIAELKAQLKAKVLPAKGEYSKAKRKALPEVVFVPRAVKCEKDSKGRATDVPVTGRGAGMWPAQIGICPAAYAHKQNRHDWINVEKVRAIVDNIAAVKKIIKQCDAANGPE